MLSMKMFRAAAEVPPTTLLEPPPVFIDITPFGERRCRPVMSVPTRLPATSELETGSVDPRPNAMGSPNRLSPDTRFRAAGVVPPMRALVWERGFTPPPKGASACVPAAFVPMKQPSRTKALCAPVVAIALSVHRLTTRPRIVTSSAAAKRHGVAPALVPSISIVRTVFRPWLAGFVLAEEPDCV